MCEFKVKVLDHKNEREVARDIVYARVQDGGIVLKDITGATTIVESAMVSYVNVTSEELHLIEHPLIGLFLNLISKLINATSTEETRKMWDSFVEEGGRVLRQMIDRS